MGFPASAVIDRLRRHEPRRRARAHVVDHLSVSALEEKYRSCTDVTAARHVQAIWLLAKGHDIAEVSATVSYARRWVERLLARYNAEGVEALGDRRRRNGMRPSVLKPELLDKLKARLRAPPPDGGLWTSSKVAAWMAGELGLAAVLPQRGWEALKAIGWSVQKPRPRHPAAAAPAECETFEKSWPRWSRRKRQSTRTNRLRSGPRMSTASG
jgi:transposase